jgi:hypothetical protein
VTDALLQDRALGLLRALSGHDGIHASAAETANYRAVFARDAVMAGVAGLLVRDPAITAGLVRTLERLRELQGAEGQIASNFEMRQGEPPRVSFGTLAPRIDSTTWYLLGVALAARSGVLDRESHRDAVRAVVHLLDAVEYNGRHLVYVPAGGNWADEYVYDGYVLYDQVLRAWALRLCGAVYEEPAFGDKARAIGERIAAAYQPAIDAPRRHPPASFSPLGVRPTFDLAACSLLALSGVAPDLGALALDFVADAFISRDVLPPAFHPVIDEGHPDWPALRAYHLHGFRNRPHEYHNGGVWPIWLGWLALALARTGRAADLARLRALVGARLSAQPGFDFEEYLHGLTGAPGGTRSMAYTATGLVFLHVADAPSALELLAP